MHLVLVPRGMTNTSAIRSVRMGSQSTFSAPSRRMVPDSSTRTVERGRAVVRKVGSQTPEGFECLCRYAVRSKARARAKRSHNSRIVGVSSFPWSISSNACTGSALRAAESNRPRAAESLHSLQRRLGNQHPGAELLVQFLNTVRCVDGVTDRPILVMTVRADRGEHHPAPVHAEPRGEPVGGESLVELAGGFTHLQQGGANVARVSGVRFGQIASIASPTTSETNPPCLGIGRNRASSKCSGSRRVARRHGFGKRGEVRRVRSLRRHTPPILVLVDVLRVLLQHLPPLPSERTA